MALQDLLASLERDATAEADALLEAARARAASIAADAAARTAQRRRETLEVKERELVAAAELAAAQARRTARARTLQARERAIERVFAAVTAGLPDAAGSPAFLAALPARFAQARACVGETPGVVRSAPALVRALRKLAAGTEDLKVVADKAVATGFVLSAGDGSLDVDETLTARLARRRPQLAVDIAHALDEAAS